MAQIISTNPAKNYEKIGSVKVSTPPQIKKKVATTRRVVSQIEAGDININEGDHWHPATPFGGYKCSGIGREHGRIGFQELCRVKVISTA